MRFALLVRQVWIWLLVRVAQALVGAMVGMGGDVPLLTAIQQPQPAAVLICFALGVVEIKRRGERNLLGNLGIGWKQLVALLAGPALIAETLVGIAGQW